MKLTRRQELFRTVYFRNWDEGIDYFESVLGRKECDKATASAIYWLARPSYYYQNYKDRQDVPQGELRVWDLLKRIEQLITDGAFSSLISYDPTSDDLVPAELGRIPAFMR